jgi:hypothetical protein
VGGIVFSRLYERKPTLGKELQMLRTDLLDKLSGEVKQMKVISARRGWCTALNESTITHI